MRRERRREERGERREERGERREERGERREERGEREISLSSKNQIFDFDFGFVFVLFCFAFFVETLKGRKNTKGSEMHLFMNLKPTENDDCLQMMRVLTRRSKR